jgi:methylated-DNA-[protein]-cysteine S-methyltransferase
MDYTEYHYRSIESPVGELKLVAHEESLAAIFWNPDDSRRVPLSRCSDDSAHPVLLETERQLSEYFDGRRTMFSLKLEFAGTEFQNNVWRAMLTIPYGETRSYGQIAIQVGKPRAIRAVGAANGKNPIAIVIPCHRVIGASGRPRGSGFGLNARSFLLALESDNYAGSQTSTGVTWIPGRG